MSQDIVQQNAINHAAIQQEYAQQIIEIEQRVKLAKDDDELKSLIFFQKHKILNMLRKLFKFLSPHKNYVEALKEIGESINDATGVNIELQDSIAEMTNQNREALEKTCVNLEKISLVLTETNKRIANKGVDLVEARTVRKDESHIRDEIIDIIQDVETACKRDMESVVKGKPNMSLCKTVDGDIYLASIKNDTVNNIYELQTEKNNGYGFYPYNSYIPANELTEISKITNSLGEIKKNGILSATKAVMEEKNSQLIKIADEIKEDIATEKGYDARYEPNKQIYYICNKKLGQTLAFDFSKPDEITADLWNNNENNGRGEKIQSNILVLKNANNGIEHNSIDDFGPAKKFMLSSLKMPEVQAIFNQRGIDDVVALISPDKDKGFTKEDIKNTVDMYRKTVDKPQPVYIDDKAFPDTNLRRALQETLGTDMVAEPQKITKLDLVGKGIRDLTGLDRFENLMSLDLSKNRIEEMNLNLPILASLTATNNQITKINLDTPLARAVDISQNHIKEFNNSLPILTNLNISNNEIREINFENIPNVKVLDFSNNDVKSINNVSSLKHLEQLKAGSNRIEGDVVINSEKIQYIRLEDNNINSLVIKSEEPVLMIEADHNPMSEAYIPEAKMVTLPKSCDVKPISDAPKEKLAAKEDVYVAVTSVSSNGEIEATTYHEDGTPAIGADKAAAVNANSTKIADTDFTRGEGVSKSAALEGSDSIETKTVVAEHKMTAEYRENSREEYKRDVKEDNQRFIEEKAASRGNDER